MSAQLVKDLKAARALQQQGWCKNLAEDINGRAVMPEDPTAVRFCPIGLMGRLFMRRQESDKANARRWAVQEALLAAIGGGWGSIICWNDARGRTLKQVLAVYDVAIEAAEKGIRP